MIDNKRKALIHIAKTKTGLSDLEYQDLLGRFGVKTSKDLTTVKLDQVMKHFKSLGFKQEKKVWKPMPSKDRLLGKIKAMRADMGLSQRYVNAIAGRMFGLDSVAWCDPDQLRKIVAALMYRKKKAETK